LVSFGSKLAFNALPAVNCENKSAIILRRRKFEYSIDVPKKKAIISSRINPNNFCKTLERNMYKKSKVDLE
tara:strand:+ start:335 stop:547 length:213 start_codon:yes stop_codon:yes gene_type:complete